MVRDANASEDRYFFSSTFSKEKKITFPPPSEAGEGRRDGTKREACEKPFADFIAVSVSTEPKTYETCFRS